MRVDVGAHLDFLDLNGLLLLARFRGFFLRRVFQLAEVDDLAHRHIAGGVDLDEIEANLFGHGQRLLGRHNAMVLTF